MRELTNEEVEDVSGGILPVVAAFASFATHSAVRSVGQYLLGRALTVYSVYGAGYYLGGRLEKRR